MNTIQKAIYGWMKDAVNTWDHFWFTAIDPATLATIRFFTGLMLLYTHLVWSLDLSSFFGPQGWITGDVLQQTWELQGGENHYFWSHFLAIDSVSFLWIAHGFALLIFLMLTLGVFSRTSAIFAFLLTVSYMHRAAGALFGLDQINVMLTMYLVIGPCGDRFSVDAWWRERRQRNEPMGSKRRDFVSANIAIRLIQIHMCVIYFFAGARKLLGGSWWDGSAMWLSIANYEYQTVDLTWLADWPVLLAFLTHVIVLFELFYCVLIWNRLTRPVVLLTAVLMHLGIATCLGMATFGLAMLIGNIAFIAPNLLLALCPQKSAGRLQPSRGG